MKNKFSAQSFWLLLKLVCIFLICISICAFCVQSLNHKSYVVPGTLISKDIELYTHGKNHRNMSTRYVMCVKPDDINKFKHYSVYVDYATYCAHNVGNKIAFSVSENECLRDFKHSIWIEEISKIMFMLFGILSIFLFAGILTVIVIDESDLNYFIYGEK